jgi:hypothetical protein
VFLEMIRAGNLHCADGYTNAGFERHRCHITGAEESPGMKIIALTLYSDDEYSQNMIEAGEAGSA